MKSLFNAVPDAQTDTRNTRKQGMGCNTSVGTRPRRSLSLGRVKSGTAKDSSRWVDVLDGYPCIVCNSHANSLSLPGHMYIDMCIYIYSYTYMSTHMFKHLYIHLSILRVEICGSCGLPTSCLHVF